MSSQHLLHPRLPLLHFLWQRSSHQEQVNILSMAYVFLLHDPQIACSLHGVDRDLECLRLILQAPIGSISLRQSWHVHILRYDGLSTMHLASILLRFWQRKCFGMQHIVHINLGWLLGILTSHLSQATLIFKLYSKMFYSKSTC